jgi:uncharacterized protein (UPF0147 family)
MKAAVVIAAMLLMLFGCSAPRPGITGRIENLADSTSIYLRVYEGVLRTVDSTVSINGEFGFDMPRIVPDMMYLQIGDRNISLIPFFVEGIPVEIIGDITNPHRIRAEGSEANEHLALYRSSIEEFEIQLMAIEVAMELPEVETDELSIKHDSIGFLLAARKIDFISDNSSSIMAAYLATTMIDSTTSQGRINQLVALLDTASMPDNTFIRRLRLAAGARR